MAELPVFVKIPNVGFDTLNTGSNVYTITDAILQTTPAAFKKVFTAGDSGSLVYSATIQPFGTNVAHIVRFAIWDPNKNIGLLIYEQPIKASTLSQTTAIDSYNIQLNMKLEAGFEIWAWSSVTIVGGDGVTILGGDF